MPQQKKIERGSPAENADSPTLGINERSVKLQQLQSSSILKAVSLEPLSDRYSLSGLLDSNESRVK